MKKSLTRFGVARALAAFMMAGALAVAGAATLAQQFPDECQHCVDDFNDAMDICNGRGRGRRACRTEALEIARQCRAEVEAELGDGFCSGPGRGRGRP